MGKAGEKCLGRITCDWDKLRTYLERSKIRPFSLTILLDAAPRNLIRKTGFFEMDAEDLACLLRPHLGRCKSLVIRPSDEVSADFTSSKSQALESFLLDLFDPLPAEKAQAEEVAHAVNSELDTLHLQLSKLSLCSPSLDLPSTLFFASTAPNLTKLKLNLWNPTIEPDEVILLPNLEMLDFMGGDAMDVEGGLEFRWLDAPSLLHLRMSAGYGIVRNENLTSYISSLNGAASDGDSEGTLTAIEPQPLSINETRRAFFPVLQTFHLQSTHRITSFIRFILTHSETLQEVMLPCSRISHLSRKDTRAADSIFRMLTRLSTMQRPNLNLKIIFMVHEFALFDAYASFFRSTMVLVAGHSLLSPLGSMHWDLQVKWYGLWRFRTAIAMDIYNDVTRMSKGMFRSLDWDEVDETVFAKAF